MQWLYLVLALAVMIKYIWDNIWVFLGICLIGLVLYFFTNEEEIRKRQIRKREQEKEIRKREQEEEIRKKQQEEEIRKRQQENDKKKNLEELKKLKKDLDSY